MSTFHAHGSHPACHLTVERTINDDIHCARIFRSNGRMTPTTQHPIRVGILGAGPVAQAIHLPTLSRLGEDFRVTRVMDVDAAVAESVAGRVGAAWTTDVQELLEDPAVDVVAVCSPHPFHAAQVIAAMRAGKRAVLCEKPFAVSGDEAREIAEAAAETGVPIVVGAMHAYDHGWLAVSEQPFAPTSIRSSIVLPPNPRFEDFATEVLARPAMPGRNPHDPEVAAAAVSGGVMGLAIHDLPLIREALSWGDPDAWRKVRVVGAEPLAPFGYLIHLEAGGVPIELHATMSENWNPDWRLTVTGADQEIGVEFTPSYVQAGSGTGRRFASGRITEFTPADFNGYEGEWRHFADIVRGGEQRIPTAELIDDLVFALEIAEQAADTARAALAAAA
ncbi:MAG: Gfo/Idh/MocA family oxidoreductase [Microbacteriaceae bacterium]|nr:Gfo/Idh/MocA family oxidoreductase [Microbacteriaceae bacterium]